ncbi:hypothetical protein JCM10908_003677 [Rhodotorula pacifica]|uniref:uncharacterized protein n=1 Tax=Rhodotorula pacifica TaxID=1495444 RepID=UPI003175C008
MAAPPFPPNLRLANPPDLLHRLNQNGMGPVAYQRLAAIRNVCNRLGIQQEPIVLRWFDVVISVITQDTDGMWAYGRWTRGRRQIFAVETRHVLRRIEEAELDGVQAVLAVLTSPIHHEPHAFARPAPTVAADGDNLLPLNYKQIGTSSLARLKFIRDVCLELEIQHDPIVTNWFQTVVGVIKQDVDGDWAYYSWSQSRLQAFGRETARYESAVREVWREHGAKRAVLDILSSSLLPTEERTRWLGDDYFRGVHSDQPMHSPPYQPPAGTAPISGRHASFQQGSLAVAQGAPSSSAAVILPRFDQLLHSVGQSRDILAGAPTNLPFAPQFHLFPASAGAHSPRLHQPYQHSTRNQHDRHDQQNHQSSHNQRALGISQLSYRQRRVYQQGGRSSGALVQ